MPRHGEGTQLRLGTVRQIRPSDVVAEGVGSGFGAVAGANFGVEIGDVALDGALAEEEPAGDFTSSPAIGDQPEDFYLAEG